ncbi:acyl carrier protein [Nonomuraea sp. NPDC049695]|uniref:acyl carrier protein n=1 Tax=Nonomuraea sp. NPDC049695 TaxID=3154734 RepID=UPI00341AF825
MRETVADIIYGFIRGRFPEIEITHDDDIFALGFINSLFAMELVMFIEQTFAVTIANDALRLDNFRTVNAMAGLVQRQAAPVAAREIG